MDFKLILQRVAAPITRRPTLAAIVSIVGFRGAAAGTAFLANVLVARQLGPVAYSNFAILFSITILIAALTGPPLDTSLVRFAARHIRPEKDESLPYFKLVFFIKAAMGALILLVCIAAARPILFQLFGEYNTSAVPAYALILAFAGGIVMTMLGFAQSYFQAHQRFARYASFELMNGFLRLVLTVALVVAAVKSVSLMLAAYVVASTAATMAAWVMLPRGWLKAEIAPGLTSEFLHLAKWVVAASFFTTAAQRIDLFLLRFFQIPDALIGNYGAAAMLALLGDIFVLTVFHVLLPKASRLTSPAEMGAFLRKFQGPSLLIALALTPIFAVSGIVTRLTFGPGFGETATLFSILFAGTLFTLIAAPPGAVVYGLGYSKLIAGLEGARFFLTVFFGIIAAPLYGATGMALTVAIARALTAVATYLVALAALRHGKKAEIASS